MSRNVYFPFGTRVVRDTYVNQVTPPQEPIKEEPIKEEPKVETPKVEAEDIVVEKPKVKQTKKSAPKTEETNEES